MASYHGCHFVYVAIDRYIYYRFISYFIKSKMYKWSAIALTCRAIDELTTAYHEELLLWQKKGVFPEGTEIIVVEDPGPELGSGGATLNAILVVAEQLSVSKGFSVLVADVMKDARILIIHVGRLYRNEPCGSAAFISLPDSVGYITPSQCRVPLTPLLHTYLTVTSLAERNPKGDGLWVCGADSMVILQQSFNFANAFVDDQSDILLFSIPVEADYVAEKHGAYELNDRNSPRQIVYRGTIDQVRSCCLSAQDNRAPLVLALVYLKPAVAESLLHLQNRGPLDRCTYLGVDNGALSLQLSFFFDFLASTFSKTTESAFITGNVGAPPYQREAEQSVIISDTNVISDARRLIWQSLHNFKSSVTLLPYVYYHYFIDAPTDLAKFLLESAVFLRQNNALYAVAPCKLGNLRDGPSVDSDQGMFAGNITKAFAKKKHSDLMGHLSIVDHVLRNNFHESLLPIFHNTCLDGLANHLLAHLDQVAVTCGSTSVTGRTLSCIADVLGFMARGRGGLRSGPAQNSEWLEALRLLEADDIQLGIQRMAELRSRWSLRSDRLVRAARHYEAAAQIFVRRTVMESVQTYIHRYSLNHNVGHGTEFNVWHRAVASARIDVSGGWSDTPPITYENGGAVLNIAILVDGKKPIGAKCRRIKEPVIKINILHYAIVEGELIFRTLDDVRCYKNPGAPGALVCAALVCTEVISPNDSRSLTEQLLQTWNSGFEITCWSDLPHGSGLGASSILAGCILMTIWKAIGIQPDLETVLNAVLYVEQLLTTGGGWQDQIGGLCPGVKIGRFESDHSWNQACGRPRLTFEPVHLTDEQKRWWNEHLLLVYTGKTRLAKNLLQEVVRSWYARKLDIVNTVVALVENAEKAKKAFDNGDWATVSSCANEYWSQKKFMVGGGGEPERVTRLLRRLYQKQLVDAGWLAGAGGGGFLYLITKSAKCLSEIENVLADKESFDEMSVHRVEIDYEPFIVDVE